jgi:hypothetical protein
MYPQVCVGEVCVCVRACVCASARVCVGVGAGAGVCVCVCWCVEGGAGVCARAHTISQSLYWCVVVCRTRLHD